MCIPPGKILGTPLCTGVREKEGKCQRKGRKRKRENEVERVRCKTFKNKDRRGAEE
jgi:hypothetical protein